MFESQVERNVNSYFDHAAILSTYHKASLESQVERNVNSYLDHAAILST